MYYSELKELDIEIPRVYTLREACGILRTSRNTMLGMLQKGTIRGFKVPLNTGSWHIPEIAIEQYISERMNERC